MKKDIKKVIEEANKLYTEILETGYEEYLAKKISDNMREKGGLIA